VDRLIAYRPATPEERAAFFEWMREHVAETGDAMMEFLGLTWDGFADLFEAVGEVRVICCGRDDVGFLWIEARDRDLHVHGIVLRPEFQGQGIGTSVFARLEEEFAGDVDVLELGVRVSNEGAIRFYEGLGFERARTIDEIGFLVYRKALAEPERAPEVGFTGA